MIAWPQWGSCLVLKTGIPWEHLPRELGCGSADRGKFGSKPHLLVDARELALVAHISGAQLHDPRFPTPLVGWVSAAKGFAGRASKRPVKLYSDQAYAPRVHPAWLRHRGIAARIARALGWLHRFRRLRTRHERRADIRQAFLSLACSLICSRMSNGVLRRS